MPKIKSFCPLARRILESVFFLQQLDVYSFGILLCEMCTRESPVPDQKLQQMALVNDRVLRDLIRRCVQRNQEARPTMEGILNELEAERSLRQR